MGFGADSFYHVFNRGINKQKIFFNIENYQYFLRKVERYIVPHCDVLAYCLMPNHFHLLISTNENIESLSKGFQITLSSYTKGVNTQENRCGSLFQQNTKKKRISVNDDGKYLTTVFNYIHANPVQSKLCDLPEDWNFSSYNEYVELKPLYRYICNTNSAKKYIDNTSVQFDLDSDFKNKVLFKQYE